MERERAELYEKIKQDGLALPSEVILTPADAFATYTYDFIRHQLTQLPFVSDINLIENDQDQLEGSIVINGEECECCFVLEKFEDDSYKEFLNDISPYQDLPGKGMQALANAQGNITFYMYLGEDKRQSYIQQLRILHGICPHIAMIYDNCSYKMFPSEYINFLVSTPTPPAFDVLYLIHATYDEEGNYWLHTHGLNRCGLIELEIIKVREFINDYGELLNSYVQRLLQEGLPSEDESLQVGYASVTPIAVKWTPWEKALEAETKKHLFQKQSNFCGDYDDREDDHNSPSGILYAYHENKYQPMQVYDRYMGDNPVMYITNEETKRMATFAKDALSHLRLLFDQNHEREDYTFMVKAGIDVDDDESVVESSREHLWFELERINDESFVGKLCNDPYGITHMKRDESYEVSLEQLSDYIIYRKDLRTLTPNTMYIYYMEHPLS